MLDQTGIDHARKTCRFLLNLPIKVTKPHYASLVIFLLIIPANLFAVDIENRLIPYAIIDSDEIVESSGLIKSKKYPGVFWTYNDSGDSARIFAISEDGKIVKPEWFKFKGKYKGVEVVNATHIDWEDIAADRAGDRGLEAEDG